MSRPLILRICLTLNVHMEYDLLMYVQDIHLECFRLAESILLHVLNEIVYI